MEHRQPPTEAEVRRDPRTTLEQTVCVEFAAGSIVGPGQNISRQGIFFTADGSLPVTVRIVGSSETLRGELVRLESMGDGRIGIAVRFVEPRPDPA